MYHGHPFDTKKKLQNVYSAFKTPWRYTTYHFVKQKKFANELFVSVQILNAITCIPIISMNNYNGLKLLIWYRNDKIKSIVTSLIT